jgi:hypothetical protein
MQILHPSKADALKFMNDTAEPPARWARVNVAQGATEMAYVVYYMVLNVILPATIDVIANYINGLGRCQ